jgi:hypothetical protein
MPLAKSISYATEQIILTAAGEGNKISSHTDKLQCHLIARKHVVRVALCACLFQVEIAVHCVVLTASSWLPTHDRDAANLFGKYLLLLALLMFLPAAQAQTAQLSGVVKDPHQALVSGAKITLTSQQPHLVRNAVTNAQYRH